MARGKSWRLGVAGLVVALTLVLARGATGWASSAPHAEVTVASQAADVADDGGRKSEAPAKTSAPVLALAAGTTTPATVRVLMPDGEIVELDMDEYLKGVVPAEIGPNSPLEAQKAQAVAARTYAATHCLADSAGDLTRCEPGVDANVDTTTRTQVWQPGPYPDSTYRSSNQAVDATHGVVLREGGRLASAALYFAHTTIATRNNEDAFRGPPYSYLRSVGSPDPYKERLGHGVGMSQVGAIVLADWGAKYDDILRHYYTGLSVDYAPPTEAAATPSAATPATPTPTPTATPAALLNKVAPAKGAAGVLSGRWTIGGEEWGAGEADAASVSGGQLKVGAVGRPAYYTSPAFEADFEFQALAVEWAPAVPKGSQVRAEVRLSQDGQTWGAWSIMEPLDGGPRDDSDRSTGLHFGLARYAQVRLTLDQGPAEPPLALDRLTVLYYDGRGGPTSAELAAQAKADAPLAPGVSQPAIVSRAAWGAPETYEHWNLCYTDRGFPVDGYIKPNAWAVHHSADDHRDVDGAAWVRIVYQFHSVGRGWGDIGYHYVVDRNGVIYQGRTPGNPPAGYIAEGGHAFQYNCGSGAVMALGNYQPGTTVALVPLTQATRDGLVRILSWLMQQYGVRPWDQRFVVDKTVLGMCGHRDLNATECPGQNLYDELDGLRDRVQAQLDSAPPTVVAPTPTATVRVPPTSTPRPPQPRPATPVATPPLGAQCVNLARQGDFSLYDQWTLSGTGTYVTASSALSPPQGLFMGRLASQTDTPGWSSAAQTVTLPTTVQRVRLAFWYAPYADGNDADRHIVELQDADGRVLPGGRLLDVRPPQNYRGWTFFEADVTDLLAQVAPTPGLNQRQVGLYFGVYNDGNGLKSFMRLDDVTLEVCGGPTPTATATATPPATPTRTATPTPIPVTCSDWTINGGFEGMGETGPLNWTLQSAYVDARVTETEGAATGIRSLRLGRLAPQNGMGFAAAWQGLEWPTGVLSATLSLSYQAQGGDAGDTRIVEFRDVTAGDRSPLLRLDNAQATGWTRVDLPITKRPDGHTAQVYFAVLDGGGANASLLVDDVSLRLCGRGLGGPYRHFLPLLDADQ